MTMLARVAAGILALSFLSGTSRADGTQTLSDRLAVVEPYFAGNLVTGVPNLYFSPQWIGGTDSFWFELKSPGKSEFLIVDAATAKQVPAFDHAQMARALAAALGHPVQADQLPINSLNLSARIRRNGEWLCGTQS